IPPPPIDTGFNGGGTPDIVTTGDFVGEAEVTQSDGRIVLVGHQTSSDGTSQYVVKRLNPDGSADGSFGTGGTVTGPAGSHDAAYAVALAVDGGILIAGAHNGDFGLVKLKPDGSPDGHFGRAVVVLIDLGADDAAYAISV